MRYGQVTAVDGLDLTIDRGTITAVLGPNGAGKTTTLETCEGYRRPQAGHRARPGSRPASPTAATLLPRIGVMLQDGGAWGGVRAMEMLRHVARAARPPARRRRCSATASGSATAAGRRTGGSPAVSSSGSASPWRWSGGPSWSSSTSPPPAWTRRRGARPGTCSRSCATAGVDGRADDALHRGGRAARRPDAHHRPRPARRSADARELTDGGGTPSCEDVFLELHRARGSV